MESLCPACARPNPDHATSCAHCGQGFAASSDPYAGSHIGGGAVPLGDPMAYAASEAPVAAAVTAQMPQYTPGPRRPGGVTFAAVTLFIYAGVGAFAGAVSLVILTVTSAFANIAPTEFFAFGVVALLLALASIIGGVGAVKGAPWGRVLGVIIHGSWLIFIFAFLFPYAIVFAIPSALGIVFLLNRRGRGWFSPGAST